MLCFTFACAVRPLCTYALSTSLLQCKTLHCLVHSQSNVMFCNPAFPLQSSRQTQVTCEHASDGLRSPRASYWTPIRLHVSQVWVWTYSQGIPHRMEPTPCQHRLRGRAPSHTYGQAPGRTDDKSPSSYQTFIAAGSRLFCASRCS